MTKVENCPKCDKIMAQPSGIILQGHEKQYKVLYLCRYCQEWYNEKGEFLQTI